MTVSGIVGDGMEMNCSEILVNVIVVPDVGKLEVLVLNSLQWHALISKSQKDYV